MPKYDEFDDQSEGAVSRMLNAFNKRGPLEPRKPVFAFAVVGGLAVLLVAVLWVSYPRHRGDGVDGAVPIVRADASPVKVAPDSQGGMDIPNRESTVFGSMRGGTPDGKVENLLPQAETPINRRQVFAGLDTPGPVTTSAQPPTQPLKSIASNARVDLTDKVMRDAAATEPAAGEKLAQADQAVDQTENTGAPTPTQSTQLGNSASFAPKATPTTVSASPATVADHMAGTTKPQAAGAKTIPAPSALPSTGSVPASPATATPEPVVKPAANADVPVPSSSALPATDAPTMLAPAAAPAAVQSSTIEPKSGGPESRASQPPGHAQSVSKGASAKITKAAVGTANGTRYVQLAAIKDRAAAPTAWKNLQRLYPQLSSEQYRLQQATVNGNNFYRVQAGPFSADQAHTVCKSINARKPGACIAVAG